MKSITVILLVMVASSATYPLFKQCDARWGNQEMGTSAVTLCENGGAVSSIASALSGHGVTENPLTLNNWLKTHKGYTKGDIIVYEAINPLGITFQGKLPNALIKINLNVGYIVICNVHKGAHYVLATGYNETAVFVNDSRYTTTAYLFTDIVDKQNIVYKVTPTMMPIMINQLEHSLRKEVEQDQNIQA